MSAPGGKPGPDDPHPAPGKRTASSSTLVPSAGQVASATSQAGLVAGFGQAAGPMVFGVPSFGPAPFPAAPAPVFRSTSNQVQRNQPKRKGIKYQSHADGKKHGGHGQQYGGHGQHHAVRNSQAQTFSDLKAGFGQQRTVCNQASSSLAPESGDPADQRASERSAVLQPNSVVAVEIPKSKDKVMVLEMQS
jgi:hypothetical protein